MADQPVVNVQAPSAGPIDVNDLIGAQRTALKAMEQFANAAAQLSQAQQQIAALMEENVKLNAQLVAMKTPEDATPPQPVTPIAS